MTTKDMLHGLKKAKVLYRYNAKFSGMHSHTKKLGRIVCAEFKRDGWLAGISFWLHEGSDGWFFGVWSGVVYECAVSKDLLALCTDMLSGKFVPRGEPPIEVPDVLRKKYSLKDVTESLRD